MGLIGGSEEVKNAIIKGLQSNVNQLDKLLKASCGDKGCCEYNDEKNQLNEVNDKLKKHLKDDQNPSVNLADILTKCKLNPSDGPLNKLNDEIPKKIQGLNEQINKLKNEQNDVDKSKNASQIDKLSKSLNSHNASKRSLETLKELCGYAEKIDKNNEQPKNLLDNLCTGLEKFLGYQNGNYTGEGIVYSDLDRLCDGVMSFLHGVLHSIKPKLGLHKNKIDEAINLLDTHKHSGKDGFNAAIGAVVEGVNKYNEGVRESNKKVSGQIHSFQRKMNELKEQVSEILPEKKAEKTIPPKPVEPYSSKDVRQGEENIKKKLEDCKNNAKEFSEALDIRTNKNKIKESIEDLNPKLQDSVMNAVKAVQHESKRLEELSEREENVLKETTGKISEVMKKLGEDVNLKIDGKVHELVEHLKGKVSEILKDLDKISKDLEQYTLALHKWIEQVHNVITAADEKVTEIVEKDNIGRGNQEVIKDIVANQLIQWRSKIGNYICNVKDYADELNAKVKELGKQFQERGRDAPGSIDKIFEEIKQKVGEIKGTDGGNGLHGIVGSGGTYSTKIVSPLNTLNSKALELTKEFIDAQAAELVERIERQLESMPESVKHGRNGHGTNLSGFKSRIQNLKSNSPQNTETYKSQFEPLHYEALKAINAANETWIGHISQQLSPLRTQAIQLTAKQAWEVQQFLNNFEKQLEELRKVATCAGNNRWNEQFNQWTRYVEQVQTDLVQCIQKGQGSSTLSALNSSLSRNSQQLLQQQIPNSVSQLQLISQQLGNTIEAQKQSLQYGTYGQPLPQRSYPSGLNRSQQYGHYQLPTPNQKSHLETLLEKFEADVKKKVSELVTGVGLTKSTGVHAQLDAVKNNVDGLSSKLDTATGFQPDGVRSSGTVENHAKNVDQAINTITKQASELDGRDTVQKLTEFSTQITAQLKELLNAFADKGADVRERLGDLAKKISKETPNVAYTLRKIKDDLSQLQASLLTGPIKKAREFLQKEAEQAEKHFAKALKEDVDKLIQNAGTDLTAHARKQYVDAIKDLLTKFAEKVGEELRGLPAKIDDDKHVGLKGFMERFDNCITAPLKTLATSFDASSVTSPNDKNNFAKLANKFTHCFNHFFSEAERDEDFKKSRPVVEASRMSMQTLLTALYNSQHFDHTFNTNIDNFNNVLPNFAPKQFAGTCSPLLDALNAGLNRLGTELNKAYVNTYDGVTFDDKLVIEKTTDPEKTVKSELTDEGRNCAKVCLTILDIFYNQLYSLFYHCYADWSTQTIQGKKDYEELRNFFERQGYDVAHLNKDKRGAEVGGFLTTAFASHKEFQQPKPKLKTLDEYLDTFKDPTGPVSQLFDYLNTYYDVCHHSTISSNKHPSSIYDMLTWLSGLTHNRVYDELALNGFSGLFEKPKNKASETQADDPILLQQDDDALDAYPKKITATGLSGTLAEVCHYSYETLVAILGNGHSGGVYACEFNINAQGFVYPSNMNTLICMLYEILQRIYEQLYFLYQMCTHDTTLSGWKECWYGSGVGGSSWKCNSLQCGNQTGDQTHNQCGNQRANQTADQLGDQPCKQHPSCGLKSPLESFLEDGLQGFLPHSLDGKSGKLNCAVKNHFNVPCKTPMGFADISQIASHRQTGNYLRNMLRDFCGNKSPLTALLSQLRCVLPSAPKTLGDMFGFYYSLLADWDGKGSNHVQRNKHREAAYRDAVQKANFRNPDTDLELTSMFSSSNHGHTKDTPHLVGDLYSLVNCKYKRTNDPAHPCGSYIKPLCRDICGTFTEKHAVV
ncbi:hypothetical protein, conserved [Babesia ovata]|uniref:Extracellular matrix-binding ebh n=1 Tax=Babesia ovata TaxID=189622 RepID=A0A2H6KKH8_9APIC|nr:uncharacterized protein BOVATA_049970 [Babesia ovata]GBE63504.1 hypothetical protein, conserved [Babesia ovata]